MFFLYISVLFSFVVYSLISLL